MIMWLLASLFWLQGVSCVNYHGHSLYRGTPTTTEGLWFFENISSIYNVIFWREPSRLYHPTEFSIDSADVPQLKRKAEKNGAVLTLLIEDIEKAFELQTVAKYVRRYMDSFNWKSYYKLNDIYSWYRDLVKMYPGEVKLINIGRSYEQRPLYVVRVAFDRKPRSRILIEGGIHAREWVSVAMATYLLNAIVTAKRGSDAELKKIASTYEWHFIPVLNPDGYSYSHTVDRLWRKNRRRFHTGTGVDINRNFDIQFKTVGCGANIYDESYCGTKPFSEAESRSWAAYLLKLSDSPPIEYYVSFHAYGQYFVIPYAFSFSRLENYNELDEIGREVKSRIAKRRGTMYTIGNAYDTVGYRVGGLSSSWAKKQFSIPYVFTMELPDEGTFGFALPPHYIEEVALETMEGLRYAFTPKSVNVTNSKLNKEEDDIPLDTVKETSNRAVVSWSVVVFEIFISLCVVSIFG